MRARTTQAAQARSRPIRKIAMVWEQFAPYHVDRCEAVATQLKDRADVTCIEVASGSRTYAWEVSSEIAGAQKVTLFPGQMADDVPLQQKFAALHQALTGQDLVIIGLASSDPRVAWLALRLRKQGAQVYFCSDSKADDYPRSNMREFAKRLVLRAYDGGIIAGSRSRHYYTDLGVEREKLFPGYDTVSVERLRGLIADTPEVPFAERPFLYLGRFVAKKNLPLLLGAYALYRQQAGPDARRLVVAGSGELAEALQAQAERLGIAPFIRWTGFLDAQASAHEMAQGLALLLVSQEEQWGLVVNEALSVGLPVIAAEQVGACDLLVRDGLTGTVVPDGDTEALAAAMVQIGQDEGHWNAMRGHCETRAWFGDSGRFADTVEAIAFPGNLAVEERMKLLLAELA